MEKEIYSIYDTKSCQSISVFESENKDTAIRSYKIALQKMPPLAAEDMRLLFCGKLVFTADCVIYPEPDEVAKMQSLGR